MIESQSHIRVRFAETDAMGIAHHGSYAPWLEIARTDLLRNLGMPYTSLVSMGFHLPVLELHLRYLRPARYDDDILVRTTLREKPRLRIHLEYELTRQTHAIAKGSTVHAFINEEGLPVRPPREFLCVLEPHFSS